MRGALSVNDAKSGNWCGYANAREDGTVKHMVTDAPVQEEYHVAREEKCHGRVQDDYIHGVILLSKYYLIT